MAEEVSKILIKYQWLKKGQLYFNLTSPLELNKPNTGFFAERLLNGTLEGGTIIIIPRQKAGTKWTVEITGGEPIFTEDGQINRVPAGKHTWTYGK